MGPSKRDQRPLPLAASTTVQILHVYEGISIENICTAWCWVFSHRLLGSGEVGLRLESITRGGTLFENQQIINRFSGFIKVLPEDRDGVTRIQLHEGDVIRNSLPLMHV
jgi:hypothetical protein